MDDLAFSICEKYNLPTMDYQTLINVGIRVKRLYKLDVNDQDDFFACLKKFLATKFGKKMLKNTTNVQNMYYN